MPQHLHLPSNWFYIHRVGKSVWSAGVSEFGSVIWYTAVRVCLTWGKSWTNAACLSRCLHKLQRKEQKQLAATTLACQNMVIFWMHLKVAGFSCVNSDHAPTCSRVFLSAAWILWSISSSISLSCIDAWSCALEKNHDHQRFILCSIAGPFRCACFAHLLMARARFSISEFCCLISLTKFVMTFSNWGISLGSVRLMFWYNVAACSCLKNKQKK